jgi:hypothetical protein
MKNVVMTYKGGVRQPLMWFYKNVGAKLGPWSCWILCNICTKVHLWKSVISKNFLGVISPDLHVKRRGDREVGEGRNRRNREKEGIQKDDGREGLRTEVKEGWERNKERGKGREREGDGCHFF